MTGLARSERYALCDLAVELGPDAPTLCTPWTVADLLAHLHLREARPDLAAGIMVPALAGRTARGQAGIAAWPFERLVAVVRTGPPVWNPARLRRVDELVNLTEFFIHHEDIRRADGRGPRTAYGPLGPALEKALRSSGSLMFRKAEVGVTLHPEGRSPFVAKTPTEAGSVTVAGPAGELLLFAGGRTDVAEVDLRGPASAVAALRRSALGM